MNNLSQYIDQYLEDKKLAWAPSTLRSEEHRLRGIAAHLNGDAQELWNALVHYKPYSRVTIWTRVTDFYQFLLQRDLCSGSNPYLAFRQKNQRLFKNCYEKRVPDIQFDAARKLVEGIHDAESRRLGLLLLHGGLRFSEGQKVSQDSTSIKGKGGKIRQIYAKAETEYKGSYQTFLRHLKAVGLKPHDLRKLCAQRLVELGANEFELCEIMGWSNLNTASSYVRAKKSRITELFSKLHTG